MEVTWNGVSSTTIVGLTCGKVTRRLVGSHRGSFVQVPGWPGSHYFPEERGRRTISIDCHVLNEGSGFPTARRDAVTEVADWLDINAECKLTLGDAPGLYYNAVLVDPPDVDEWRELGEFTLVFEADPYAYALTPSSHPFALTSGVEVTYDFDIQTQTWPVIEVTPTDGISAQGFELTVGTQTLVYSATVATDDTVTINGIGMAVLAGTSNDVYLTGAYDPLDQQLVGVTGVFPIIVPGDNSITITTIAGTATTYDVNVHYRKRYRN